MNVLKKVYIIIVFVILVTYFGCGAIRSTRELEPVPSIDSVILKRTKAIATTKDNISVIVVYLQETKELDGFGIMIVNETPNQISFTKEECMLVQGGKVLNPLSDSKAYARLGVGYKPKLPNELNADIYEWRKDINLKKSRQSKAVDSKVMDKDKDGDPIIKISLFPGTKETVYVFFNTQGNKAPMQLIIPNIYNEATKQRTTFSFQFKVKEK